jgi:hypothetical protein
MAGENAEQRQTRGKRSKSTAWSTAKAHCWAAVSSNLPIIDSTRLGVVHVHRVLQSKTAQLEFGGPRRPGQWEQAKPSVKGAASEGGGQPIEGTDRRGCVGGRP